MRYNLILSIASLLFSAFLYTTLALATPPAVYIGKTPTPFEAVAEVAASNESSDEDSESEEETVLV